MVCLVFLIFGFILLMTPLREITVLRELGLMLCMFSAGYGLRDSLEGEIEDTSFDDLLEFLLLNENNIAKKSGHWAFLTGIFKDLFKKEATETETE